MNWEEVSRKLPLICCIELKDLDNRARENLLRCSSQFDFNVALLRKESVREPLMNYLSDNQLQNFAVSITQNIDMPLEDIGYSVVLQNFRNCHCLFVSQETSIGESIRWRVFDKIVKMSSPYETVYLNESCEIENSLNDRKMILRRACQ